MYSKDEGPEAAEAVSNHNSWPNHTILIFSFMIITTLHFKKILLCQRNNKNKIFLPGYSKYISNNFRTLTAN
jgi:hypothetical protein